MSREVVKESRGLGCVEGNGCGLAAQNHCMARKDEAQAGKELANFGSCGIFDSIMEVQENGAVVAESTANVVQCAGLHRLIQILEQP